MPVDRVRQPHRKHSHTEVNTSHSTLTTINLLDFQFPSNDVNVEESNDDDLPPPLVEAPQDDPPPLASYHDQNFFDYVHSGFDDDQDDSQGALIIETPDEIQSFETQVSSTPIFPEPKNPPISPSKPSHHKKRPADHIPRPPNAFILFRASFIKAQHIPGSIEPNNNTLSRIIGLCWKSLPQEERDVWKEKARKAMEEHKRLYPSYRYNPRDQQNRAQSAGRAKRKVKEIAGPPLDPGRCEEIARMLVEGKKGNELENAVRQLDRQAAALAPETEFPIVQTRFDPPLTERTFRRRSLSVPPQSKDEDTLSDLPSPTVRSRSRRTSRKRSQSTSIVKVEVRDDATPTKREEANTGRPDSGPPTPFQFYIDPISVSIGSPTRARNHASAPQTPTLSAVNRLRGHRPGIPYVYRTRPPSDNIESSIAQEQSPNMPPFMAGALTESFSQSSALEPSPIMFRANNDANFFENIEPRQPHPVYATTYSSLEGWDGIAPSNTRGQSDMAPTLYSTGAETITSASNSPITPPYQFRFDHSQQPSPAPLTGHASEYLDNQWPYDSPVFDLGASAYQTPNGNISNYREGIHRLEVPCSPGVQNLTGHIHDLAISNQMATPYDHRQRSMSLDSGVHHPMHNTPHLVHFSSQNNFKNL